MSPPTSVPTWSARRVIKGALIVIHEYLELVDHIKSIADRYAAEGYLVLAPDLLSSIGIEARSARAVRDPQQPG